MPSPKPTPMPDTPAGWLREVLAGLDRAEEAAMNAALASDGGEVSESERWRFNAEQAVVQALEARGGAAQVPGGASTVDMDAITDITVELRRLAPGDPDDVHLDDLQHFLLYYLAAHVHARRLDERAAGRILPACWDAAEEDEDAEVLAENASVDGGADGAASGEDSADDSDDGAEGEDDEEDDDGEPWPISRRPPASIEAWVAELVAAYQHAEEPPPLITEDEQAFVPGEGGLLEAAVILSLHNRGARIPVEAVYGLIGVIDDMVKDIRSMGPEWEKMQQVPPLSFTIYYVWTHIVIGHLSEDLAMEVVQGATDNLDRFGDPDAKPGKNQPPRRPDRRQR